MNQNALVMHSEKLALCSIQAQRIFETRGTSLIGKSVRDFFRTKGFTLIFDGFFLKTKGFLPKVYEIFGSEMPLALKRKPQSSFWQRCQ